VHVFVGPADSRRTAGRLAHEVYDAALAAYQEGQALPGPRADGWGARGVRPGWEPDWQAATAGRHDAPYSWAPLANDREDDDL
jgi:hypothetical protein